MTDNYKQKYDELMKRCADFMQDFAQPSSYELGFRAGWEAAKQEFHKDNTYVPNTTKRTTNPWPPTIVPTIPAVYQQCGVCGIQGDINKAMSYVCNNPNCPTRVTCISTTGTAT
jgi:hypothetical protein